MISEEVSTYHRHNYFVYIIREMMIKPKWSSLLIRGKGYGKVR